MINFVLEKFETDRDLRLFYAEIFQFVMLDEYQDTNNAQNRIIELILSESFDAPISVTKNYGSDLCHSDEGQNQSNVKNSLSSEFLSQQNLNNSKKTLNNKDY
jgi:DNA helicase-2/ATP-dependent DNA helicase PcrA